MTAIKRVGNTIIGQGILFTDETLPDLDGEYFAPDTDYWLDIIPTTGVLFNHTMSDIPVPDAGVKDYLIGTVKNREVQADGIWFEAVLDEHIEWVKHVLELIDMGVLRYSTDSISHLVRYANKKAGVKKIESWPIPLISVTHQAAQPLNKLNIKRIWGIDDFNKPDYNQVKAVLSKVVESSQLRQSDNGSMLQIGQSTMNPYDSSFAGNAVKSLVLDNWSTLKNADMPAPETTKEVSVSPELAAQLQPMVDQLVSIFGGTPEQALGAIVAAFSDVAAPVAMAGEDVAEDVEPMAAEGVEVEVEEEEETAGGYETQIVKNRIAAILPNKPLKQVRRTTTSSAKPPTTGLSKFLRGLVSGNNQQLQQDAAKIARAYKAQGINPDTAGGYLVPPEQSTQIIELLRAKALLLQDGWVTVVPLNRDTLILPKQTGASSVRWVGENTTIQDSSVTFGQVVLVARKMAVLIKISNELLADSDPDVDAIIRNDIALQMANEVDRVIYNGSGVGNEPLGILNRAGVEKTTITGGLDYPDLVDAVERLETANVDPSGKWAWMLHPKAKAVVRQITDPLGQYIFTGSDGIGQQVAGPLATDILDYPWKSSTLLPLDGSGKPRIIVANWSDIVVGMRKSIEMRISQDAGTSFEDDQTWIRAIVRLDVALRHDESVQVLENITAS